MPDAFKQWLSTDRRRRGDASLAVGYSN